MTEIYAGLCRLVIVVFFALPLSVGGAVATPFDSGRVGLAVEIKGLVSSYRDFFTTALPNEAVTLKITRSEPKASYRVYHEGQLVKPEAAGLWRIRAPGKAGTGQILIKRAEDGSRAMSITLFTLVPATAVRNGELNKYRIGSYPSTPYKGLAEYLPPRGYIEVTEANRSLAVSPHFTLGQFLCKQASAYPKYLVLRPALLVKLEGLLADVNARGIRTDSFHVMSGYRTPYYNAQIKNVANSRHLWGGAADIYIDVNPADGVMDDLNGDGRITKADAMLLYQWADVYVKKYSRPDLTGGVGAYNSNAYHGPFVHVDVRGQRARWGAE